MFERLSIGWQLAKQSITVLKLDKELFVVPCSQWALLYRCTCQLRRSAFLYRRVRNYRK